MNVCPRGHETRAESDFCVVCGSPIRQELPPVVDDPAAPARLVITGDDLSGDRPTVLPSRSGVEAKNPDVVEARRRLVEEGYIDEATGEVTHGAPMPPMPPRSTTPPTLPALPRTDGAWPGRPARARAESRRPAPQPTGPRYIGDADLGGIKLRQGVDSLAYVIAGIAMIVFGVSEGGSGWGVVFGIAAILYGGWILVAESYWVSTIIYVIAIIAVFAAFGAGSS